MWTILKWAVFAVGDCVTIAVQQSLPFVSMCWIMLKCSKVKITTAIFQEHLRVQAKANSFKVSIKRENHKYQFQSTISVCFEKADLGKSTTLQQKWEGLQSTGRNPKALRGTGLPWSPSSVKGCLQWTTTHSLCCNRCSRKPPLALFYLISTHPPSKCFYYSLDMQRKWG